MPLTTDEKLLALSREAIEVFDKVNGGVHPGFRPAHAKGILLTGTFTPSPEAASLTRAPHLQRNSTPVTVRFSDATGIPTIADNDPQHAAPRGFAVRFHLGTHIHTDIISHSVDAFPARTAEGLIEFLNAVIATDPAGPHPNAIEQFLAAHPAASKFVQVPKPIPTSFAKESFFAVSAFKFTNAEGVSRYEREDGDMVNDATIGWPEERPQQAFGEISLREIAADNASEQQQIIFDPIPRVDGIEASADPLFEPRANTYLMSGRRRRTVGKR